jgi:Uma2 family endonuclease
LLTGLKAWHWRTGLGWVLSGGGLVFSTDTSVIPDLVVEVLSSGVENEKRDFEAKLGLYDRQGVLEYWILNWWEKTVTVYRRGPGGLEPAGALGANDRLSSPRLPGFETAVADIYRQPTVEI